ncbi:melanin-concentrating hormone receptor 1-like [Carcharodon carcharias]|uniref:melanin-concentrating hormone receptor 1-like n=1 Tax=Carcharodon carcharias TaxID=13397 RepID=UPI001B7F719C|nr:melanin-concentrating hormone receptor 1-like [Carcharodon carcharias]
MKDLQELLKKHASVFREELGKIQGLQTEIHVDPEATPRYLKARPVPYALREKVDMELDRLERDSAVLSPRTDSIMRFAQETPQVELASPTTIGFYSSKAVTTFIDSVGLKLRILQGPWSFYLKMNQSNVWQVNSTPTTERENGSRARHGNQPGSDQFTPYTNIIMPSVFGVISFLGVTGNCIVIYTIVRKTKFRCKHMVPDIFIFNLSLVDLLFLLGMPFLIHQLVGNGTWHFGAAMCTIITTLDSNSQITSTYILTVMSFDRYLATVHPLKSTYMCTTSVATLVICLVWLMSFLTIIPVWLYTGLMPLPDGTVGCALLLPNPTTDIYWFTLYQFTVAFAIPLVIICVIYFKILQHMSTSVAPLPQRNLRMQTRKVTRMAMAICSTFFLCWGPYYIFQLVHLSIEKPSLAFIYTYNFAISLGYANSCINPFLYIALSETFKHQFLMTVHPAHQRFRVNNSVVEGSTSIKLSSEPTQQMRFTGEFSQNSLPVPVAVH